jgi:hypothetical protein
VLDSAEHTGDAGVIRQDLVNGHPTNHILCDCRIDCMELK